ncbi:hypothetical protein EBR25_07320 [bacterium]|nr:hypothetical protein [bacterium]
MQQVKHFYETTQTKNVQLHVVAGHNRGESQKASPLDVKYYGKPKRQHVKEFGCLFGAIFASIAAYQLSVERVETALSLLLATIVIVSLGSYAPKVLYPLWSGWMAFANALGMVMSLLFVALTWCLMAVPLGILLRLIGKKVMDLSFDRSVPTYWEVRKESCHDFQLLERQF